MPFMLRVIRKARWFEDGNIKWLPKGEPQADALIDLSTKDNSLSLFYVTDDKSNINRIAAAYAANRQKISNLDYLLFDEGILDSVSLSAVTTLGDTPDIVVNTNWHRDVQNLSASKILDLARILLARGQKDRITHNVITTELRKSIAGGNIDRTQIKLSLEEVNKIAKPIEGNDPVAGELHD